MDAQTNKITSYERFVLFFRVLILFVGATGALGVVLYLGVMAGIALTHHFGPIGLIVYVVGLAIIALSIGIVCDDDAVRMARGKK
jgi:hypothetical protein